MQLDENGQPADRGGNLVERTVSELSAAIRRTVEQEFGLVRVRGEVGRVSRPGSGHVYLDLKDERAVLSGVIWKSTVSRLKTFPEQGLEVVVTGKVTTFPGQSKYQIVIETLEPAGAGALMALLEARKKKLEAQGLFAAERKRALPFLPRVIGVVTSPTGAVIRDVLHRITDRFPLHVIVWPVRVQGERCGSEVAAAIRGFNAANGEFRRPDLIIVARGGGSLEDLWGFNEEEVVRAAAESGIPLISAIGHETDWTLIDFASDYRAPTPTGAAEIAVPVRADLAARIATLGVRLHGVLTRNLDRAGSELRAASRGLGTPDEILAAPRQNLDATAARLANALILAGQKKHSDLRGVVARLSPEILMRRLRFEIDRLQNFSTRARLAFTVLTERRRTRLEHAVSRFSAERLVRTIAAARGRFEQTWRLVQGLSHQRVLERGFALARTAQGVAVTSAAALAPGDPFLLQFHDGEIDAITDGKRHPSGKTSERRPRKQRSKPAQGRLF